MLTLYIISNCDTCRKARKALNEKGIPSRPTTCASDRSIQPPLAGTYPHRRTRWVQKGDQQANAKRLATEAVRDEEKDFDATRGVSCS